MKSLTKRVLTSVIALPILFFSAFFLPEYNHPLLVLIILVAIAFGTQEMSAIVKKKGPISSVAYFSPLIPVIAYAERMALGEEIFVFFFYIMLAAISFSLEVFRGSANDFEESIDTLSRTLLVMTYPALISIFFLNILFLNNSSAHIALYFALVFGEDTFAYFSGMLFGKNNRGIVQVSPNKSVAGFIAGAVIPALILALLSAFFEAYSLSWWEGLIVGFFTAVAGICGDLIESAFKRSSAMKDSGTVVPGRGGILDSIDSLIIAAPVYIALLHCFRVTI